jgi:hypothetical protein
MLDQENLDIELKKFKDYVIQQSKSNLTKGRHNFTKSLYNSIKGDSKAYPRSYLLSFSMDEHGYYQDQGVRGKTSSIKAPNSPFKFGTGKGKKGGLTTGIKKWVRAKRFQFKNRETGKFMSYDSTALLIARSIYNKGLKPTLFFTKPFNNAFKRLPEEMVKGLSMDVDRLFKYSLKQPKK